MLPDPDPAPLPADVGAIPFDESSVQSLSQARGRRKLLLMAQGICSLTSMRRRRFARPHVHDRVSSSGTLLASPIAGVVMRHVCFRGLDRHMRVYECVPGGRAVA